MITSSQLKDWMQVSAYEKQGRVTIAHLKTKFRGYRHEKSHATHQEGVW